MKPACASNAFDRSIERGDLTQLEFLDLCAHELACDGVALDVRHFPRTDADYLAQVKKMATDRGLAIAALCAPAFDASEEALRAWFGWATTLGAPLLAAPLPAETARPWSEQLERIGVTTSLAKAANVTLALRNAPGSFAAGVRDCKRVGKEADSAWLRYGPEPGAFASEDDPGELAANSVLVWAQIDAPQRATPAWFDEYSFLRGFVVLDDRDGTTSVNEAKTALAAWRRTIASLELNRT